MKPALTRRGATLLLCAIGAEVVGTMALRAAVDDSRWTLLVLVAYTAAFTLLGFTLRAGVPIGVAYGVWAAGGVVLTALLGALLFAESLGVVSILGIGLMIAGVVLIETGHSPARAGSHTGEGP